MGSEGIAPRILNSALDWGEWSTSRPGHFIPVRIALEGRWPQSRCGRCDEENNPVLLGIEHRTPVVQPSP
jgi:hypothetical protein